MAKNIQRAKQDTNTALYFCIFILFLSSMGLWIGWDGRTKYINYLMSLSMLFMVFKTKVKLVFKIENIIPYVALLIAFAIYGDLGFGLGTFLSYFIPCGIIIFLNEKDQVLCLRYIVKWFSFLMIPCLIVYFIVQLSHIPSFGQLVVRSNDTVSDIGYLFRDNYFFYCYSDFMGIRFNGPFVEPGHLGMMSAFLLYADGFNLKKKETWILLVTIFFTFSLSGFGLGAIAFLFTSYAKGKISMRYVLLAIFLGIAIYLIGIFYNDGKNLLNELILSRFEYDEDRGFVGNNRIFGQVELYYLSMFNDTELLLHGYDEYTIEYLQEHNSGGIGFAFWMTMNGLLGTLAAYSFYFLYMLFSKNKKAAVLFFVFFIICFWQRSYPFWFAWIICYVYGITNDSFRKLYMKKK